MAGQFVRVEQLGGVAGFDVDTTTVRAMMMSIGDVRQQLDDRLSQIYDLKIRAKLGELPEAQAIAELNAEVAAGNQQSLEYVLQRFRKVLDKAHQALEIGMSNYEQIEAQAKKDLRRAGGE